jgi:cytochrome P450
MMYYYYIYYPVLLATMLVLVPLLLVKLRPGKHTKNPPPGPWQLPVIGSLHHLVGALPHYAMRDLARRHGPLMLLRLGEIRVVVASSASAAREVLKTHDSIFATRPETNTMKAVKGIRGGMGIIMAPQGEHWSMVRKLCVNELLSARQVRSFQGTREAEAGRLVASVALASSSKSQPVNFGSHLATYLHDVVVRAVVGDRITDREAFIACLDDSITAAAGLSLADLFPSSGLARAFGGGRTRRLKALSKRLRHALDGVLAEQGARRSGGPGGNRDEDLLDVMLRIQAEGTPLEMGTIRTVIIVRKPDIAGVNQTGRFRQTAPYTCLTRYYSFHCRISSRRAWRPRRRRSNGPWRK